MRDYLRLKCEKCGGSGRKTIPNPGALRAIREAAGLGLCEFARQVGVSAAFVSDVELGRRGAGQRLLDAYRALGWGAEEKR